MDTKDLTIPKYWYGRGSRRQFIGVVAAGIGAAGIAGGMLPFSKSSASAGGVVLTAPIENAAQSGYAWAANHGLDGDAYQAEFDSLVSQGFRLIKISGYSVNGQDFYASIWDQSPGPAWAGLHRVPGADYQAQFDSLTSQGLRPVDISGYEKDGSDYFAAIFEQSEAPGGWSAAHGVAGADYQALFDSNVAGGLMPLRVSGYSIGGADYYASIWIGWDGRGWSAVHGLDDASYRAAWDTPSVQGKRLVDISGFEIGGTARYAAIWDDTPKAYWITNHDLSADSYQSQFDENTAAGYTPIHVAGYGVAGEARYAGIWAADAQPTGGTIGIEAIDKIANDALAASGVPGLSIAIAKNGMLVYAKGYGMADASVGEAMTVKHRARIASCSKTFTGAAIVQLQEQGVLNFTDNVFGDNGWLGNTYGTLSYSSNQLAVTIDDLLHHVVDGWQDTNKMAIMGGSLGTDRDAVISWVMDNLTVVSVGNSFHYSNFGYCLLGQIIQVATGQDYESYLQNNLMAQCGITSMQTGGETLADRLPDEVVYTGGSAYNIPTRLGAANGGWIATPTDLLRFMVRFDGLANPADVVSATSLAGMTTGTTASPTYGRGFGGGPTAYGHGGGFSGTESVISRQPDGTCYAVIANGDSNANMDAFNVDTIGFQMSSAAVDW
ncbi:MAG: serine hydrolase, partial [Thermomicrobiales bacterium]